MLRRQRPARPLLGARAGGLRGLGSGRCSRRAPQLHLQAIVISIYSCKNVVVFKESHLWAVVTRDVRGASEAAALPMGQGTCPILMIPKDSEKRRLK